MRIGDFWKKRRARRAAIAIVAPLVAASQRRLHMIPDSAWLDPYLLGYLTTLITLVAEREVGRLGTDVLGLVQAEAWATITGQSEHLIGEEVSLHSVMGNRRFQEGCANAQMFFRALHGLPVSQPGAEGDEEWPAALTQAVTLEPQEAGDVPPMFREGGAFAASLWSRFFDAHVRL